MGSRRTQRRRGSARHETHYPSVAYAEAGNLAPPLDIIQTLRWERISGLRAAISATGRLWATSKGLPSR